MTTETANIDEIIPNLWISDFSSAKDGDLLRSNGIQSILSVLKGPILLDGVCPISSVWNKVNLNILY